MSHYTPIFLQYLMIAKYLISSSSVASKILLMIPNYYIYVSS